jgi:site-specific recombinase XerD
MAKRPPSNNIRIPRTMKKIPKAVSPTPISALIKQKYSANQSTTLRSADGRLCSETEIQVLLYINV